MSILECGCSSKVLGIRRPYQCMYLALSCKGDHLCMNNHIHPKYFYSCNQDTGKPFFLYIHQYLPHPEPWGWNVPYLLSEKLHRCIHISTYILLSPSEVNNNLWKQSETFTAYVELVNYLWCSNILLINVAKESTRWKNRVNHEV